MVIIGHRGAMGYEPENTLRSFEKAISLGVDMIELDVYVLHDGTLVVIHDDKVDRTTNGTGYVMDKTFSQLRKLDAGKGERIPTLQEVLDLVNRRAGIVIELKGEGTATAVATVIEEYVRNHQWQYDDFIVSSFRHPEVDIFRNKLLQVRWGAHIGGIPLTYAKFGEDLGAYAVKVDKDFINQAYVDDAHKRGLKMYVFTVNDYDDIEKIKSMGVDGIFTNYPDRLRPQPRTRLKPKKKKYLLYPHKLFNHIRERYNSL